MLILTWVSDKFRCFASSLRSAPTTYWFFSKACSNFNSWLGLKAVRILFGLRKGSRNSGKWGPVKKPKKTINIYSRFDYPIQFKLFHNIINMQYWRSPRVKDLNGWEFSWFDLATLISTAQTFLLYLFYCFER